jgi:hypothetical protein
MWSCRGAAVGQGPLPEGVAGMARLHAMIGEQLGEETGVLVGIETEQGPWVAALIAAGYTVFAINPLQVAPLPIAAQRLGCHKRRR